MTESDAPTDAHTIEGENTSPAFPARVIPGAVLLLCLFALSQYDFLLFHVLAELISISISWAVFFIVWNARGMADNKSLVFIGIAYFFVGFFDLLHTVSYKGMGVFGPEWGANLPTQLWIAGRYMESLSLAAYARLIGKSIRPTAVFYGYLLATVAVLSAILWWPVFPDCFLDGSGLTPFKIISEYLISGMLAASWYFMYRKRALMDAEVFHYMTWAICITIAGELLFTFYASVYALSNVMGHFCKILSFYFIYLALVRTSLSRPYAVLFRLLKENEEKYQNIFQNAHVGLLRIRLSDGRPADINRHLSGMMGYSNPEECLSDLESNDSHGIRRLTDMLMPLIFQDHEIKDHDLDIPKRDGTTLRVSMSARASRSGAHAEVALVDITGRKRREQAMSIQLKLINSTPEYKVRDLLRSFLDEAEALTDSHIGFFHFIEEDQEMISLETWSTNTLKSMCRMLPETGHYPVSKAGIWTRCLSTGGPVVDNDYESIKEKQGLPEGHAPVIRQLVVPVIRAGKYVAILGVGNKQTPYSEDDVLTVQSMAEACWEVLMRKQAEDRVQKSYKEMEQTVVARTRRLEMIAHEFETLFNASQVGMIVLSKDRIILKANQRLADIFGYGVPEEMIGLSIRIFHLSEKRFSKFGEAQFSRLQAGENLQIEYELKQKDGRPIWCSLSGKALDINRPADLEKGVMWVVDDISERKKAELKLHHTLERLERSNAELSQFVYVASHDLQEPLRSITGFLQLLESRYADRLDDKGRHYIERTIKAGSRLQSLITDLLSLSRINSKVYSFEETDLNEITARVIQEMKPRLEKKKVDIRSAHLPVLTVNRSQISTLFFNLVSNAVKFNENMSPRVEIGVKYESEVLCFFVKDNGIGINEKFLDRIFIIFQRLHGRNEYSGTGIGLTLCKKIVERHGGRIWVESLENEGTTVFFTLPQERPDEELEPEPEPDSRKGNKKE